MVSIDHNNIIIIYHSETSGATKSILSLKKFQGKYFDFIKIPPDILKSTKILIRYFKKILQAKIIIFNGLHTFSNPVVLILSFLFKLKKKKILLYWHESGWHWRGIVPAKHGIRGFIVNIFLEKLISSSFNMTVSKYCVEWLKRKFDLDNIDLLYNTIDYNHVIKSAKSKGFDYTENTYKVVMSIAPPTERKGFVYFLKVAEEAPNSFRFVWIGKKDDLKKSLSEQIKNVNDEAKYEKIIILNYDKNPYRLLKYADLFFLPSLDEPFGLVYLESFILGKYVIAPVTCGFSEIIDQPSELAFIYEDISQVSEKLKSENLEYYLDNFKERRKEIAKSFDNLQFYRGFLKILKRIMK